MSNNKLLTVLSKYLGVPDEYNNSERYYFCPLCHHHNKKLAVNISTGFWHCWVCEASGKKLYNLLYKIGASKEDLFEISNVYHYDYVAPKKNVNHELVQINLPPEYIPLYNIQSSFKYDKAVSYLKYRNITKYDILKYNIGYCEYGQFGNRIIIPSYNINQSLNYYVGRSFFNDDFKYLLPNINKDIIFFENLIDWNYPITLVEGVFDAIAAKRNAIPLLGKYLFSQLKTKILKFETPVYICLDKDARKSQYKICNELYKDGIDVFWVELNEKDPSLIGYNSFKEYLKRSTKITPNFLIKKKMELL